SDRRDKHATGKALAQIVLIGTIATTGFAQETWKKSRRERGGNKRRKVYREVSFNALLRQKSYGNEDQADYVAWLVEFGRAAHRPLKPTGSFVLDLGGAYQRGRPVRSLYNFRVLIE